MVSGHFPFMPPLLHEGKFDLFNAGLGFHGGHLQVVWDYYSVRNCKKLSVMQVGIILSKKDGYF